MKSVTYTEARNQLAGLMETATRDHEPITITRNGAGTVVNAGLGGIRRDGGNAASALHSTPANAERIRKSPTRRTMRLMWLPGGWADYLWWQENDRKVLARVNELIRHGLR